MGVAGGTYGAISAFDVWDSEAGDVGRRPPGWTL
jgi:hypothetical protein